MVSESVRCIVFLIIAAILVGGLIWSLGAIAGHADDDHYRRPPQ